MRLFRTCFAAVLSALPLLVFQPAFPQVTKPAAVDPYRDEAFVFEQLDSTVRMHADGTGETSQHTVVRVLSDGVARQFSVLNFSYASANETAVVDFVRVHKPDGTTVETPVADAMEMPAEVSREAPMYSDIREKHLPVRSLAAGDRLEYQLHTVRTKAEAPNQFWGAEHFDVGGGVVLAQTITLQVPVGTFVQVWSPNHPVTPTTHDGLREWRWTSSQIKPSERDANGKMAAAEVKDPDEDSDGRKLPSVAWTTFHNWAEVGDWYRGLIEPRMQPTAAIRAKADELTKDAKTPEAQAEALYRFVASQIRYVSISFGTGRIQPHAAAEVLANGYGDCKDKDTLLESLLRAKGFVTAPVLIGAGIAPLPDVPTPAVFNHEITTVQMPGSGSDSSRIWLDTTAEVAPFRVLLPVIRDQQALVVPATEPASLIKTPADPPYPYREQFDAVATLDKDGLLKSHMQMRLRSDGELGYRIALQRASPAQWDDVMQYASNAMSFGGKVSNTDMRQADPQAPVQITWDYTRPEFADWKNSRILPLFPLLEVAIIDKEKAPEHDISLGAPRTLEAHTTIALPPGFRAELPAAIHVKRAYTTFDQTYRLADGKLQIDRTVVVLQAKLPKAEWRDYVAFSKAIGFEDGENFIPLIQPSGSSASGLSSHPDVTVMGEAPHPLNMDAMQLMRDAESALKRQDWEGARKDLAKAMQLDPKTPYLMSMLAALAEHDGKHDEAIADLKAELRDHPDVNSNIVTSLALMYAAQKRYDDALTVLSGYRDRKDTIIPVTVARIQIMKGDDPAALATMQAYLGEHADDRSMRSLAANTLYRMHRFPEAAEAAKKAMDGSDDPYLINNNVYLLSEMKIDLPYAETNSRRSVDLLEKATAMYPIAAVNSKAFADSSNLTASWDTLAYILLLENKPKEALPYFEAAWFNQQDVAVGNHLGQVYELLGRKSEALAVDRLALLTENAAASKEDYAAVQASIARLEKAGVKASGAASLQGMRTFSLRKTPGATGGGTVRVQISERGTVDAMLISGGASLKPLLSGAKLLPFPGAVPPGSPAHVLHDAVLYCGKTTSTCDFVLMPHSGIQQEGAAE